MPKTINRLLPLSAATVIALVLGLSLVWAGPAPLSSAVKRFVSYDQAVVAITHVRVIDGHGTAPVEEQTVLIRNGEIAWVRSGGEVPKGATVIDGTGETLLPGIVGMHEHMFYPEPSPNPEQRVPMYAEQASSFPKLYLAGGVTSIRTTGSLEPYTDIELKKAIDAGKMAGPKIHITAPYMEGKGSFALQLHQLTGAEDARRTAEYWIAEGATSFKAYMFITPVELSAIIKVAHAHGIKVTGHLCAVGFTEAADLGIDNLEHGIVVDTEFTPGKKPDTCDAKAAVNHLQEMKITDAPIQALIKHLIAKHVAVTSTLPVFETFVPGRAPIDRRVLDALLPEARIAYLERRAIVAKRTKPDWAKLFKLEEQFEYAFVQQGGTLLAGLDPTGYGGVIAGFGDQREIELLVEAGFTPVQAIKIATLNGAEFMGEGKNIGSIDVGKAADLVLVKGNPAKRIKDIENVQAVFKDGVGYDPAKLVDAAKGTVGLR